MFKKTILTVVAAIGLSVLLLTGCGGAKPAGSGAVSGTQQPATAKAEVYDVGVFTVELPAGWKAFPQQDIFAEKDENGEYPIDKESIYVSKDAKTDVDLFSEPYISFNYSNPNAVLFSGRDMYDDVKDIEVKVDGAEVTEAFQGTSSIGTEYIYQIITLKYEGGQFVITIPISIDGKDTGLKWDAEEVLSMINSLTIK